MTNLERGAPELEVGPAPNSGDLTVRWVWGQRTRLRHSWATHLTAPGTRCYALTIR
jgi:hypothetical protein